MRGLLVFLLGCGSTPVAIADAGAPDSTPPRKDAGPPDPGRIQLTTFEGTVPFGVAVDQTHVYYSTVDTGLYRQPKWKEGPPEELAKDTFGPHTIAIDDAFVYAADLGTPQTDFTDGRVVRVSKKGGALEVLAKDLAATGIVALYGDDVYFTTIGTRSYGAYNQDGAIWRMPKDGSAPPLRLAKNQKRPSGMAVSGAYVYWANENSGTIHRCAIDGCNETPEQLYGDQNVPRSVNVDDAFVYWTTRQGTNVSRAPKGGGGEIKELAGSRGFPEALVIDKDELFWGEALSHTIMRQPKDGSDRARSMVDDIGIPAMVAVDDRSVYFADQGQQGPSAVVPQIVRIPR